MDREIAVLLESSEVKDQITHQGLIRLMMLSVKVKREQNVSQKKKQRRETADYCGVWQALVMTM